MTDESVRVGVSPTIKGLIMIKIKKFSVRKGMGPDYHTARLGEEIIGVFWGTTSYDTAFKHIQECRFKRLFRTGEKDEASD